MSDGIVRLMCPNLKCRTILAVPGSARGRVVRCAACGGSVRIPSAPAPSSPVATPPPAAAGQAPPPAK
jgi:hypothetical protein